MINVTTPGPTLSRAGGRKQVYYWKCDRPSAFHGTGQERDTAAVEPLLRQQLEARYPGRAIRLRDGGGQGNHLTWKVEIDEQQLFARIENGPERDNHLQVESQVMARVRACGVPTPQVLHVDTRRSDVPFAWQLMDRVPALDLNAVQKAGELRPEDVAFEIGEAVARWQAVDVSGFGHFQEEAITELDSLVGFHARYRDYFFLNWERHLSFLETTRFLTVSESTAIRDAIHDANDLLDLTSGCLVHKDLAFWNILGDRQGVVAYIDWDDAIAGDETDDLSLLACFHEPETINQVIAGYRSIKPLPQEFDHRFWLHLVRNLVVKAVIRVGAGYFDRTDRFFLIGSGMTGADLMQETRSRLFRALDGLVANTRVAPCEPPPHFIPQSLTVEPTSFSTKP